MKCTARDILDLNDALARHGGLNLAAAVVLPFSRLQRAVRLEAETISEAQQQLAKQHTEVDANGKPVEVTLPNGSTIRKPKDPEAFEKAIKDLHATPVEIPGEQFAATDLLRGEVNSTLVAALHWVIKA